MVGETISYLLMWNFQGGPDGGFDVLMADLAITHADGTAVQIPVAVGAVPFGGNLNQVTNIACVDEKISASGAAIGATSQTRSAP